MDAFTPLITTTTTPSWRLWVPLLRDAVYQFQPRLFVARATPRAAPSYAADGRPVHPTYDGCEGVVRLLLEGGRDGAVKVGREPKSAIVVKAADWGGQHPGNSCIWLCAHAARHARVWRHIIVAIFGRSLNRVALLTVNQHAPEAKIAVDGRRRQRPRQRPRMSRAPHGVVFAVVTVFLELILAIWPALVPAHPTEAAPAVLAKESVLMPAKDPGSTARRRGACTHNRTLGIFRARRRGGARWRR